MGTTVHAQSGLTNLPGECAWECGVCQERNGTKGLCYSLNTESEENWEHFYWTNYSLDRCCHTLEGPSLIFFI